MFITISLHSAKPSVPIAHKRNLRKDKQPIRPWLIRWKQAPDTMTLHADTPIQPIQQAWLELVLNALRHYWSEETVQAAAPLIEDLDLEIKSVTYIKPQEDIPLKERVRRANKLSCQIAPPIQETIISIHVDGIIDFINQCANEPLWNVQDLL